MAYPPMSSQKAVHALLLGVAAFFLGEAFLAGAFRLVAGAFFTACGAVDLVTRPDLVFPRTTGAFSSTAGACGVLAYDYAR